MEQNLMYPLIGLMFANKFKGIRSVDCFNEDGAKRAKAHYNANVLAIPAEFINIDPVNNVCASSYPYNNCSIFIL